MQANYPRAEIRKHLGRVADKHFATEYEERKDFDPSKKLQLMEDQMRNELTYINKLANLTIGHDAISEYKPELSKVLVEINTAKAVNMSDQKVNDEIDSLQKKRYKYKKCIAFPGKNENVLDDMVTIAEVSKQSEPTVHCHPRKKLKMSKKSNNNKIEIYFYSYSESLFNFGIKFLENIIFSKKRNKMKSNKEIKEIPIIECTCG